jgi:hypothetical protein
MALSKPVGRSSRCSRQHREYWIRAKYLHRAFISRGYGGVAKGEGLAAVERAEQRANELLYEAASRGDVHAIVDALAHNADVNWVNGTMMGTTAVHVACAHGHLGCLELLLANGGMGSLYLEDTSMMAPLDYAEGKVAKVGQGSAECKELLVSKFEEDTKPSFPSNEARRSSFSC